MNRHPDHADVVALPPVIYGLAVLAGVAARWLLGGSILPGSGPRMWVGVGLCLAGLAIGVGFERIFAAVGEGRNPRTPTTRIFTHGLYRFSRNPVYVGLTFLLIGLALTLDNPWLLATLVVVIPVMHFGVVLREEAYLERKFGDEYLRYKRRVRRYL